MRACTRTSKRPMWLEWSEGREEEETGLEWWPGSSPAHGNKFFLFQGIWLTFSQGNRHCWCSAHIPLISHVYLPLSCWGHCFLGLTVAPFSGTGGLLPERYCFLIPGDTPQPTTVSTLLPQGGSNQLLPELLEGQVKARLQLRPEPCWVIFLPAPSPAPSRLPKESLSSGTASREPNQRNHLPAP